MIHTPFPLVDVALETIQTIVPMTPPPKSIPGVDEAIRLFLGWTLYIVSILSLISLMIVLSVGFEAYKHNQGEQLMEKLKGWILAAIVGAYAKDIVTIFLPGFNATVVATAIPGMDGPVRDVIGYIVGILQLLAFAAILFLAIQGFVAFKNDGVQDFISKFFWWIVGALGLSLVTNIAGAFFPLVLKFG